MGKYVAVHLLDELVNPGSIAPHLGGGLDVTGRIGDGRIEQFEVLGVLVVQDQETMDLAARQHRVLRDGGVDLLHMLPDRRVDLRMRGQLLVAGIGALPSRILLSYSLRFPNSGLVGICHRGEDSILLCAHPKSRFRRRSMNGSW